MPTCKLCGQRPATVPDRERPSPRKSVCSECHSARLRGDLHTVLAADSHASIAVLGTRSRDTARPTSSYMDHTSIFSSPARI